MRRRKIAKLYKEAEHAYQEGLVHGAEGVGYRLAGRRLNVIASEAGYKRGQELRKDPRVKVAVPERLPTEVWALVLAEALRPGKKIRD